MNKEAVPILSNSAIIRLYVGRSTNSQVSLPMTAHFNLSGSLTMTAPDYIQHLDLHFEDMSYAGYRANANLIDCFSGNTIVRKTCKITARFHILGTHPLERIRKEAFYVFFPLIGFKVLTLKIEHGKDLDYDAFMFTTLCHPVQGHPLLLEHYEKISGYVAATFGPFNFNQSVDGHCLVFRPIEYQLWGALEATVQATGRES